MKFSRPQFLDLLPSLVIYVGVLSYSAALAVHVLFIAPDTRLQTALRT
jgi:hypothetical protein